MLNYIRVCDRSKDVLDTDQDGHPLTQHGASLAHSKFSQPLKSMLLCAIKLCMHTCKFILPTPFIGRMAGR